MYALLMADSRVMKSMTAQWTQTWIKLASLHRRVSDMRPLHDAMIGGIKPRTRAPAVASRTGGGKKVPLDVVGGGVYVVVADAVVVVAFASPLCCVRTSNGLDVCVVACFRLAASCRGEWAM